MASSFTSPATTPRTSRRLTTNLHHPTTPSRGPISLPPALPPLPPLNLRPYPLTPYAQDPLLQQKLHDDWSAVDYAVQSMTQRLSDKKRQVQAALSEMDEEKRRVEMATKGLGEQAKELMDKMTREQNEHKEAKQKKQDVDAVGRSLEAQMEGIAAEIKEEQKKLHARRERESPRALSFAVWSSTSTRSALSECVLAHPPPLLHARTP